MKTNTPQMEEVDVEASKRFFVEMLTRDIELKDAILDLVDNCLDGIHRNAKVKTGPAPYKGFWAKLSVKKDYFEIEDNCGGIPADVAKKFAFRLGRPKGADALTPGLVGRYGIGMKRAIFKMGRNAIIESKTSQDEYRVTIEPKWFDEDDNWKLGLLRCKTPLKETGTKIRIDNLYSETASRFRKSESQDLAGELSEEIAQTYSFIITKGFRVEVNSVPVLAKTITFLTETTPGSQEALEPYRYSAEFADGALSVSLIAGLSRSLLTDDELDDEAELPKSAHDSGWTIVCNDRVVLANDRTIHTGWGEATTPAFHNQFIGISGIVEFRSADPALLPMTTTKRGIDQSSEYYLTVKQYMREATSIFTSYTNAWKADRITEKKITGNAERVPATKLLFAKLPQKARAILNKPNQHRLKPVLPKPPQADDGMRVIRFSRPEKEIRKVSRLLFGDAEISRHEVGEKCFELQLKKRVS